MLPTAPRRTLRCVLRLRTVQLLANLTLQNVQKHRTLTQSMTPYMRWQGMRLDTARHSRDFLRDISAKKKCCKINIYENLRVCRGNPTYPFDHLFHRPKHKISSTYQGVHVRPPSEISMPDSPICFCPNGLTSSICFNTLNLFY